MPTKKERIDLVIEIWNACQLWLTKPEGTTTDLEDAIESVFYKEIT